MAVDNGAVQTAVWAAPAPLTASISVTLDPARTQTPENYKSMRRRSLSSKELEKRE